MRAAVANNLQLCTYFYGVAKHKLFLRLIARGGDALANRHSDQNATLRSGLDCLQWQLNQTLDVG